MPSRERKKELKRIADSRNQRELCFALARKQQNIVSGHNLCTDGVIQIFTNFY